MNLLLDTHTFIWWNDDLVRMSPRARALCEDPTNQLFLSVASIWEMQIKIQLGRFRLTLSLAETIARQQQANQLIVLPVTLDHVLALENLPHPHRDPFDRLLVAQAITENAILVSRDPIFAKYPVQVLW